MKYLSLKEFIDVKESDNLDLFLKYKKIYNVKKKEIEDFYSFSKELYNYGKTDIDGWFLFTDTFVVPDFDVLLFLSNYVINIDLKHEADMETLNNNVSVKFKKQNRIFRILGKPSENFVYVTSTNSLFYFDLEKSEFKKSTFSELDSKIHESKINYKNCISELKHSDFLINPWADPEKLNNKQYWLNYEQQQAAEQIINPGIHGVSGEAGTGKTLIAVDVMVKMSKEKHILFIVPGIVNEQKQNWASHFPNIDIISAKDVANSDLNKYNMIVVDESQRLHSYGRNILMTWGNQNFCDKTIIFFFHVGQTLGRKEAGQLMNSVLQTAEKDEKGKYITLKYKVRSNPAISYFSKNVMDLGKSAPANISMEDYMSHIDLKYFSNVHDAKKWIRNLKDEGYEFLTPTSDNRRIASSDKFNDIKSINTHHSLGEEMDKVVTYIDESLIYKEGKLAKNNMEYYFIDNELYVNLTRARDRLALAIINNPEVYSKILEKVYKLSI